MQCVAPSLLFFCCWGVTGSEFLFRQTPIAVVEKEKGRVGNSSRLGVPNVMFHSLTTLGWQC